MVGNPRSPLIAVVGSLDERLESYALRQVSSRTAPAEAIGRELARAHARIVAYSSEEGFVDSHVVRGFIGSGLAKPRSIVVRYPSGIPVRYPEVIHHPEVFDFTPERSLNWEVAFYRSIRNLDGLLVIGGGSSSLTAGMIGLGLAMPLVAVGTFGGAAPHVWEAILGSGDLPAEDLALMNPDHWEDEHAEKLISLLMNRLKKPFDVGAESSAAGYLGSSAASTVRPLRVFLCHSFGDKEAVRILYHQLAVSGFDPWLDQEKLLPGDNWDLKIRGVMRESDVVLVCLSKNSVTKRGYVQKELRFALDLADEQPEGDIFLIPGKLEECDIPERLKRWHWVELYEKEGFSKLVEALLVRSRSLDGQP